MNYNVPDTDSMGDEILLVLILLGAIIGACLCLYVGVMIGGAL